MKAYLAIAAMIALASPALAGVEYATYEGPDAVQTGRGGSKVTKNGVDFWTVGTPPRRFQVLGVLTDSRTDQLLQGNAIGSKGLAKRVLAVGGHALIVADQNERYAGSTANVINGPLGPMVTGRDVNRITTSFYVVKYLEP